MSQQLSVVPSSALQYVVPTELGRRQHLCQHVEILSLFAASLFHVKTLCFNSISRYGRFASTPFLVNVMLPMPWYIYAVFHQCRFVLSLLTAFCIYIYMLRSCLNQRQDRLCECCYCVKVVFVSMQLFINVFFMPWQFCVNAILNKCRAESTTSFCVTFWINAMLSQPHFVSTQFWINAMLSQRSFE